MDFFKNLGFDPVMLGAQILNFLIIFFLLKRFMYKPVLDMLKKREEAIKTGVKQAEQAKETLDKALLEERGILTKAQDEAKKIIEDAKLAAIDTAKEIEENTKKETERMLIEAKAQIEQESKIVEAKLSEKISVLAADMLTKSLGGMFGEKEQKQIIGKALKQIKKTN